MKRYFIDSRNIFKFFFKVIQNLFLFCFSAKKRHLFLMKMNE